MAGIQRLEQGEAVSALTRFLGDSPLRVIVKLLVISLIVGFVMSAFHWSPWDIFDALRDTVVHIWDMGFAALGNFFRYIVLGAVIVVPVFFILRLLSYRR
ncbi:DUF6460 domain-containing protein [Chelativorans salis]|uniref:DUF6460 domain-containing protein n=1 Tax=Chelativorans salis TaxID=2978478 RepID=A0ABT2LWW1_9HYPH|nr:DUF6460 domain-containing protein [Chelativorans sp. EGI FJ00035]MCT7378599.1 DUF6460 domain-containing protein [Chelativorans sp. EGI FJ00035]